jgi:hypothetical protein
MEWLKTAMLDVGLTPSETPNSSARSRLLSQADRMLAELSKYKTEQEMDGDTAKFWWSPQSNAGQRRLVMRYGNKIVPGTGCYVENTLEAVREGIEAQRKLIENSKDEDWAEEEARREKK